MIIANLCLVLVAISAFFTNPLLGLFLFFCATLGNEDVGSAHKTPKRWKALTKLTKGRTPKSVKIAAGVLVVLIVWTLLSVLLAYLFPAQFA
jgi:hypothetical protein